MGLSSDWAIEEFNEALNNDADFRTEWESYNEDLDAHLAERDESEIDFFPEFKLDHSGYAEFKVCPFCHKYSGDFRDAHYQCEEEERAWFEYKEMWAQKN